MNCPFFSVSYKLLISVTNLWTQRVLDQSKGQLISKCLHEIIVWTKIPTKILIVSALALSGQKLSNFLLVFWSKRRLQKDILKLTDLLHVIINIYTVIAVIQLESLKLLSGNFPGFATRHFHFEQKLILNAFHCIRVV
jgi:hypothetical protein